jgi:SAM-dependent methyltransferase
MNAIPMRGPWQGVRQIFAFNRRFYLVTLAAAGAALCAAPFLPGVGRAIVIASVAPALYWLVSSLLVSHYVYDRYPLYDLGWLARALACRPRRWLNLHCGLDETSALLREVFPEAEGQVVDIFDGRAMTEDSIRRARELTRNAKPATPARYDALPFEDCAFDAVFALFAAHELRRPEERMRLFREVERVLAPGGDFVVMEHARDWQNFFAFGPGFLHFFSRRAWRKTALAAGLALCAELAKTPFVRVYVLRRVR